MFPNVILAVITLLQMCFGVNPIELIIQKHSEWWIIMHSVQRTIQTGMDLWIDYPEFGSKFSKLIVKWPPKSKISKSKVFSPSFDLETWIITHQIFSGISRSYRTRCQSVDRTFECENHEFFEMSTRRPSKIENFKIEFFFIVVRPRNMGYHPADFFGSRRDISHSVSIRGTDIRTRFSQFQLRTADNTTWI